MCKYQTYFSRSSCRNWSHHSFYITVTPTPAFTVFSVLNVAPMLVDIGVRMSWSIPIQICHRTGIREVWGLGWWAALYVVFVPGVSGLLADCWILMSCHNIRNLVLVPSVLVHVHSLVCSGFDRINSDSVSSLTHCGSHCLIGSLIGPWHSLSYLKPWVYVVLFW